MTIKAVLFDLDGTLLDRDRSILAFVNTQYDRLTSSLGHIPKADYVSRLIELDCRGQVWKDKVYQALVDEFTIVGLTWEFLLEDYVTQFQQHCIPFDGMEPMLCELRRQHYLLGIVTNGRGQFQRRSIDGLNINKFFDVVIVSEEVQLRKPQPEIFRKAADRLDVQAGESIFIGDNPKADVIGAKNAGMKAIWKRSPYQKEPEEADAIIDELGAIPSVIALVKSWK